MSRSTREKFSRAPVQILHFEHSPYPMRACYKAAALQLQPPERVYEVCLVAHHRFLTRTVRVQKSGAGWW